MIHIPILKKHVQLRYYTTHSAELYLQKNLSLFNKLMLIILNLQKNSQDLVMFLKLPISRFYTIIKYLTLQF